MKESKLIRILEIFWVLLVHLVFYRLNSHRKEVFGARLRKSFQKLGVIFIKFGQLLSSRYDMLMEENLSELRKLLDQDEPISDEVVKRIIQEELGVKGQKLNNLTPLSCASIAQVYSANLGKQPVAVKVLRPGIREKAELDLLIFYQLAKLVEVFSPRLRRVNLSKTVNEMRKWIEDETNLSVELQNMERFRFHLASTFTHGKVRPDLGRIVIPKTYQSMSTSKVLVMEYLDGVTIADWLRGKRSNNEELYDPQMSVMTSFVGSLRPIFQGSACPFHGDPNPANLVILKNGDIGLIDFGLMGQYSKKIIDNANRLYFGIYLKNTELTTKALMRFAQIPRKYYEELLPDVEVFLERATESRFADWMKDAAGIIAKHKLSGPIELPMMGKFVLLVDSLAHEFFPGKSTIDLLGSELEAGIIARTKQNLSQSRITDSVLVLMYTMSELLADGPEVVGRVFGRLL